MYCAGEPLKPTLPDLDTVEDGLIFRQCVRDRVVDPTADNQQIVTFQEEEEEGGLGEMLAGFSRKERKRILKYVSREAGEGGGGGGSFGA